MEELNKFSRKINWQLDLNWALALDYLLHLSREGLGGVFERKACSGCPHVNPDRPWGRDNLPISGTRTGHTNQRDQRSIFWAVAKHKSRQDGGSMVDKLRAFPWPVIDRLHLSLHLILSRRY